VDGWINFYPIIRGFGATQTPVDSIDISRDGAVIARSFCLPFYPSFSASAGWLPMAETPPLTPRKWRAIMA